MVAYQKELTGREAFQENSNVGSWKINPVTGEPVTIKSVTSGYRHNSDAFISRSEMAKGGATPHSLDT